MTRFKAFLALVALVVAIASVGFSFAQETGQSSGAGLDLAPANTAIYLATSSHEKLSDLFWNSNAMEHLRNSPAGQKMKRAWRKGRSGGFEQFGDNPFAQWLEFYQETFGTTEMTLAWPFIDNALGQEVFVFADENVVAISESINRVYYRIMEEGGLEGFDDGDSAVRALEIARDELRDVKVPNVVVGCVLKNPSTFRGLLDTFDSTIDQVLSELPPEMQFVANGFSLDQTEDSYVISLTIQGDEVPWDMVLDTDEEMESLDALQEIFAGKSVTLSLAIMDNLMLLAITPDQKALQAMRDGPHLIDIPHMEPVRAARERGEPLVLTSWSSDRLNRSTSDYSGAIQVVPELVGMLMQEEGVDSEIADELVGELEKDLVELVADMQRLFPQGGDRLLSLSLTDQGIAGVSHAYKTSEFVDSSGPLDIVQHAGQHPALVLASRQKNEKLMFDMLAKWIDRGFHYVGEFAPVMITDESEQEMFSQVFDSLEQVWSKVESATADDLIPGSENGQGLVVMGLDDARSSWHPEMPDFGVEVPFPWFGAVSEISDRQAIERAGKKYWEAAQQLFAIQGFMELDGMSGADKQMSLDEFVVPVVEKTGSITRVQIRMEIPEVELGDFFQPTILLDDSALTMASTQKAAENLHGKAELKIPGPAGEARPASSLFYLDFSQFLTAARQWTEYSRSAIKQQGGAIELRNEADSDMLDFTEQELMDSAEAGYKFLGCFKGISSIDYEENGAQVGRFLFMFKDMPPEGDGEL